MSSLPITTIEEADELAKRCSATSKAIYAFLAKNALRTDEATVLAEYRQKFEAKVSGLYGDLLTGGMVPPDQLASPVRSHADIPWVAHILASRSDILQALFERTYQSLSPGAQRVFLTLCGWRSTVPLIVLEAVILHTGTEEPFDVTKAAEELGLQRTYLTKLLQKRDVDGKPPRDVSASSEDDSC